MERIDQSHYYKLGRALAPLRGIRSELARRVVWVQAHGAKNQVGHFLTNAAAARIRELDGSIAKGLDLHSILLDLAPDPDAPEFEANNAVPVGIFTVSALTDTLTQFETILFSELARLGTFLVTRKAIFETQALIESADECLAEDAQEALPEIARTDLKQAGRCLAFELSTAVGFHLFRAMEAVIREYFPLIPFAPTDSQRNWGLYIGALKKADVGDNITTMLDHIKNQYRNPITHPEVTLAQEEAIRLFGVAPSVIAMMASDLSKRRNPTSQTS